MGLRLDRRILDQGALLPGSLNVNRSLRDALGEAIHACSLSRHQIVDQLSDLSGRSITKTMLDHYTAESKESHRFPAELLPAFCAVVGSMKPIEILAEALGGMVLSRRERAFVKLIQIEREKARLDQKARDLREQMAKEEP
jgi:hypothetical protein